MFREDVEEEYIVTQIGTSEGTQIKYKIEENVKRVIARPFSGSHEKMYQYLGKGFQLDCRKAYKWLDTEPQSREKEVLEYQLRRYEKKGVL